VPKNSPSPADSEAGYELNQSSAGELNQDSVSKKKGPTPKRAERVEARKRPLVSSDRAEARKTARATMQLERDKQRIGMANGVEKYLPLRDRGVQKRYVRDYVDARTSVGEFMLPILVVVIIMSLIDVPAVQLATIILLWLFLAVAAVDVFILGRSIKKKLGAKFGESKIENGVRWYAGVRAMQLRQMRLPKPQVKRGNWPS
jgi:hypothetical protein